MITKQTHRKRWFILAPTGVVLVGLGLSLVADAAIYRYNGAPTLHWVAYGTLALGVFNSGLSIFGRAILEKIRSERADG
jgi:hypothetical protein